MKKSPLLFIFLTLLAVTQFCIAQRTMQDIREGTMTSGLEEPIVAEQYVLMPGDSLLVTVSGATNYSYLTGVTYEGKVTINIPVTSVPSPQGVYVPQYDVIEAVPVYGLNMTEAKDSLKHVFRKYFRGTSVDVTLVGMRSFTVFVVGEIRYPGKVRAWPVDRVSVVIDRAGGITTAGSRSRIQVRRHKDETVIVDVEEFQRTGSKEMNPFVQDGDIIYVPRMKKSVVVSGAVYGKYDFELVPTAKTPEELKETGGRERFTEGIYELIDGETIADIITKAGGITPWTDLGNVYIDRKGTTMYVNLAEVLADENSPYNILMADGDILYVPSTAFSVYVQGEVVEPGVFAFQPHLHVSDYLGLAGGPLTGADLGRAHVVRGKNSIPVHDDPVIEPGDKIVVPRVVFKFWQDYVEITAVFASLLISYLTLIK
jgi:protein involved in polysaccharide export with SLBB domain